MTGVLGLNYAPPLRKFAQDPTVIFTSLVILTPLVYATSLEAGIQYMTTPMMLGSFAFLYGVLRITHASKCVALSARDERVANWFLMNGVYFNLFLDVVSGQFQMMDEMSQQYRLVEPRYVMGVQEDGGQSVFMTSMLELFFQSPFCLLAYYGYHKGLASRRICEFFVCVLHMTGVWYFYIPEVLVNFRHLGGWPASLEEALSFDRVLHFWFAFWFCGILWLVVPFQIAHTAWKEICELISSVEYAPTVSVPKIASKAA